MMMPFLEGAVCSGGELPASAWDIGAPAGQNEQAARACLRCPALDPCRAWVTSLPRSQRPSGVVAGTVHEMPVQWTGRYRGSDLDVIPATAAAIGSACPPVLSVSACVAPCMIFAWVMLYDGSLARVTDDGTALAPAPGRRHRPGLAARMALLRDCWRANSEIAAELHCAPRTVLLVRQALEAEQLIPAYRGRTGPPVLLGVLAGDELLRDPERTNLEIARACGCGPTLVLAARLRLEAAGKISRYRGHYTPFRP